MSPECPLAPRAACGNEYDAASKPAIQANRWTEDWSVFADPRLRTEPVRGRLRLFLGSRALAFELQTVRRQRGYRARWAVFISRCQLRKPMLNEGIVGLLG